MPYFDRFIGECPYPSDMPYPRKGPPTCPKAVWTSFLSSQGLGEIQAPPGGRAYRAIWDEGYNRAGWWQLVIDKKGDSKLTTSNGDERGIADTDITAFESALSKSEFATLVPDDDDHGLDACQDAMLEAVVDGRYHFVRRGCGYPQDIDVAIRIVDRVAGVELTEDQCFFLPPSCVAPQPPAAKP